MEATAKKAKSMKNAEKRRERSKVAARCRRGKECEIFNDLSASLPMPEGSKTSLDKASVMRLTLCNLKLKKMLGGGSWSEEMNKVCDAPSFNEEFDSLMDTAMGGFMLVCGLDGDVIFASEGITTQLGVCQYEIMGQSIFDFSHQYDHNDIRNLLSIKKGEGEEGGGQPRSSLFRMKCTISSRGRNAHMRSANYKVINCVGRIFEGREKGDKWFVSICEPLLHPSDVDIPLNKQTFLSKHTPDMKFEYVDESVSTLMGYKQEEMLGKSLFQFNHASDGDGIAKSFKSLFEKDQNQTDRYRFLTKGGGWIWIITQATVIHASNGKSPSSIVCIHFITSGKEDVDQILSTVQLGDSFVPIASPLKDVTNNVPAPIKKINSNIGPDAENNFISDLLVGPLLNNATCSTSKIFAPKTAEMDSGFLVPNEDATLIICKEEPGDLTHLAPMAGDECVPLDVPLLEDLLASLDETDEEMYTFLDPDSDEIPKFSLTIPEQSCTPLMLNCDPPMVSSPGSTSSLYSPYLSASSPSEICSSPIMDESFYCGHSPIPTVEQPLFPMMNIQEIIIPESNLLSVPSTRRMSKPLCVTSTIMKPRPPELDSFVTSSSTPQIVYSGGPTPAKLSRAASQSSSEPERVYIFVPIRQPRRDSNPSGNTSESSDDDSSGDQMDFLNFLKNQQSEVQKMQIEELLSSMKALHKGSRSRKRNNKGSLLGDRPFSFQELTNQDCEVNAPIATSEFLTGPEVVKALDGPVDAILFGGN